MSFATSLTLWSALVLGQTGLPPVPVPQAEPATDPAIALPSDATPQQLEHIEQAARQLREAGLSGLAAQLESALKAARQTEARKALAEKQSQLQTLQREIAALEKQLQASDPILFRFTILSVDRDRLRAADPALAQHLVMQMQAGGGTAIHAPPIMKPIELAGVPKHLQDHYKPFPVATPKPSLTVAELLNQLVAAKESGAVKVLSEPTILTRDGQEARLHTGGEFPIIVTNGDSAVRSIEYRNFGTTVTVRPRVVSQTVVHCLADYQTAYLNFGKAVVSVGGSKVPGLTKCQIATQFTAKFGETVMFPSPETESAVTLVFVAVESAGDVASPSAAINAHPIRVAEPNGGPRQQAVSSPPPPPAPNDFLANYAVVAMPRPPVPQRSISPISYLLQSLTGPNSFFGPTTSPASGRVGIDFEVEDIRCPTAESRQP